MTRLSLYVAMSGAILATSALAEASDNGCVNSNDTAAGCGDSDPANGVEPDNPDYESTKHDQTATSEVIVDAYLNAELTDNSDGITSAGFSSVTLSMDNNGDVDDELFNRNFRISSNADHEVQVWYDAISVNGTCVPVFNAEGGGSVAGEADVIGGSIVLKVGTKQIFSASAGDNLDDVSPTMPTSGVSVACGSSATEVDAAVVTVKNYIASTFSREYTLDVTAFGEDGSIVFDNEEAINAGDAPAGQYDNDILITAGTLNTYTNETANDAYANAAFTNQGAAVYQGQ